MRQSEAFPKGPWVPLVGFLGGLGGRLDIVFGYRTACVSVIPRFEGTRQFMTAKDHCGADADGSSIPRVAPQVDRRRRKAFQEQFRLAFEAAPTGMLMTDGPGRIVLVNAQLEKLFGYAREELLGQRIEILVPERFRTHHPGLRDVFFADPTTRPMGVGRDLYGLRKNGTEVPIEIGLNPLQTPEGDFVLSCVSDITERKRADERFQLAIEAAPTGMLMMDGSGKIVLVNAQIEKLFGYPREELLGRHIEVLVPPRFRDHHPSLRNAFLRDPTTRPMGGGRELYGLRKDGSEVPVEIGLNPLRTADGEFVLSSVVDISDARK